MMTDKTDKTDRLVAALDRVTNAQAQGKTLRTDIERAVNQIVERLGKALAGERLRGLPNLGTGVLPFYGVNLSAALTANALPGLDQKPTPEMLKRFGWLATKIPFPNKERDSGKAQLVLAEDGKLWDVVACRRKVYNTLVVDRNPWFEFQKSTPHNITVHQLGRLVEVLPLILDQHLQAVAQEEVEAREAKELGKKLGDTVKRFEGKD